jgi:hypothetical protein
VNPCHWINITLYLLSPVHVHSLDLVLCHCTCSTTLPQCIYITVLLRLCTIFLICPECIDITGFIFLLCHCTFSLPCPQCIYITALFRLCIQLPDLFSVHKYHWIHSCATVPVLLPVPSAIISLESLLCHCACPLNLSKVHSYHWIHSCATVPFLPPVPSVFSWKPGTRFSNYRKER